MEKNRTMSVKHINYCSIESIHNDKFINKLYMERKTGGEWVVTEKIHGANFCMIVTDREIHCSRRKSLLTEEESFYNWKVIREKYTDDALSVKDQLSIDLPQGEDIEIRIYAELFGGYYPELGTEGDSIRVQKGLYYAPYNDIIVFDIKVNGKFIEFSKMLEVCSKTKFMTTEALAQGSFEEMMKYDPYFETTLPSRLGMLSVPDNICEGIVIKPMQTQFLSNGTRIIIKKKNERFAEITGQPGKQKRTKPLPKKVTGSDLFNTLFDELSRYFNENRLDAVVSKIGSVSYSESNKLVGLLTQDALKDFMKLNLEVANLSKSELTLLKKSAPQFAFPVVQEYFKQLEQ